MAQCQIFISQTALVHHLLSEIRTGSIILVKKDVEIIQYCFSYHPLSYNQNITTSITIYEHWFQNSFIYSKIVFRLMHCQFVLYTIFN